MIVIGNSANTGLTMFDGRSDWKGETGEWKRATGRETPRETPREVPAGEQYLCIGNGVCYSNASASNVVCSVCLHSHLFDIQR